MRRGTGPPWVSLPQPSARPAAHLVRARSGTGASFLREGTVALEKRKRMRPLRDCGCHMRPHEAALLVLILTHRAAVKFLERRGAMARTPKLPRAPWEEGQVLRPGSRGFVSPHPKEAGLLPVKPGAGLSPQQEFQELLRLGRGAGWGGTAPRPAGLWGEQRGWGAGGLELRNR